MQFIAGLVNYIGESINLCSALAVQDLLHFHPRTRIPGKSRTDMQPNGAQCKMRWLSGIRLRILPGDMRRSSDILVVRLAVPCSFMFHPGTGPLWLKVTYARGSRKTASLLYGSSSRTIGNFKDSKFILKRSDIAYAAAETTIPSFRW